MNIWIRVDSSSLIGTGHVMRCLTLAKELSSHGASVTFMCRSLSGNIQHVIRLQGFRVLSMDPYIENELFDWSEDASLSKQLLLLADSQVDWLIVDHYQIDYQWERVIRLHVNKLLVIDDLANRQHVCDLLLDQNYYDNASKRYNGLIPPACVRFLGPQYSLLRTEFKEARQHLKQRTGHINRVLVFYGGSDPTNETQKTLEALRQAAEPDWHIDVVVGVANPRRNEIEEYCLKWNQAKFHCQVTYMAKLMADADLAIGAGGTATWERMFLGLPSITVIVADNQKETTEALAKKELIWCLGASYEVTVQKMSSLIEELKSKPEELALISLKGLQFIKFHTESSLSQVAQYILGVEP
ncbi:UDP-2,4-diacetamido-2,4,6-trideoxy-beta-L-altropyranose hydrolase [Paenibacillus sp. YYML68]|uniref:UDP-2,4-diacetamido-2,4, 6-trideoxy-beta-L-altropyranose hydrolase n=1 Tax=Paenibacillus sp. YYML68 TaxID=2909250 RepID=UPI0024924E8D|nr:UDP-2,4-diacetamido-2,4,6-trideoxy-beta-L-altropyranose hydrolase [Paenibacillus sp. YYML68]